MIPQLLVAVVLSLAPRVAHAWNVACEDAAGEECEDGYQKVRTPWGPDPQSEHRRLFERTLELSGLPAALQADFELTVHADDATLFGEEGRSYKSIRPVRNGARHIVTRELTIHAMSNLPDNSYTLWDWASGNELCPPDRGNADALDCHNYETHIGWLNANHMLPQSQRFYEHLHRLALDRARECKTMHDALPDEHARLRFRAFLLACEKEALILEAVGHHYLQDSWSMGHMWERWGGVEVGDFRGNRALGFAIAAFTGTIHGAGAMIPGGAADDPMCAPHADDNYVDDPDALPRTHPGVGDVYLEDFLFDANGLWAPQRRALFGCAVDGVRAVYGETAQVHGAMQAPKAAEIDGSRRVSDLTCWRQRATNKAIATGCGIHYGKFPLQQEVLSGGTGGAIIAGILPLALSSVAAEVFFDLEILPIDDAARFARDAAYTCTLAAAHAATPGIAEQTNLAEGGLPALVGVQPNSFYARGNAFSTPPVPPASYADPALPWDLDAATDRTEKEALNLTFADAHAADRCRTFTQADLNVYPSEVEIAEDDGDPVVLEARCSQCAQLVAPHLRFGMEGNHDARREAFCAFVTPSAAFLYTEEDPSTFTGDEPTDLASVRAATRTRCGCGASTTTTTTSTTTTTLPGLLRVLECTRSAVVEAVANVTGVGSDSCFDSATDPETSATCAAEVSGGDTNASGSGEASFAVVVTGGELVSGITMSTNAAGSASGGGSLEHSALGNGVARVRCYVAVDAPLSFNAAGGGSASPATTTSAAEVVFRIDRGATIARFEQAGGAVADTFPASGTLQPGVYEIFVRAVADASLARGGGAAGAASFTLTVGTAP